MVYTDTIAAIATALSSSGIGIIRISGSDAVAVAERMFEPAVAGKRLSFFLLAQKSLFILQVIA